MKKDAFNVGHGRFGRGNGSERRFWIINFMDRCGPTYSITAVPTQKNCRRTFYMYPKDVAP